jgi:hypothetical protein
MIAFPCPKCQASLKAPEHKVGARSKCPRCGNAVEVPPKTDGDADLIIDMVLVEEPANALTVPAGESTRQWYCRRDHQQVGPVGENDCQAGYRCWPASPRRPRVVPGDAGLGTSIEPLQLSTAPTAAQPRYQ